MVASRLILPALLVLPLALTGQSVNRYVVHFADKGNTPYTVDHPEQFLSSRSIERRNLQQIEVTSADLPVDPAYVAQVKDAGARTFFSSRWMNCLLVEIRSDSVAILEALPFVSSVEYVAPNHQLASGRIRKFRKLGSPGAEPITALQLHQVGIDAMHAEGYRGEGVLIAVMDAGFPGVNLLEPFSQLFEEGRVLYTLDVIGNSGNVYQYNSHGTEVLSVIGAEVPGQFTGGAPAATFCLFVTEDAPNEYRIEEYNWLFAAERADSIGVDIITTSLGYSLFDDPSMDYTTAALDGKTAVITRASNFALDRGITLVCAAGNEGNHAWHLITPPADADGILATGAVDSEGAKAKFSSFGPTADNRIKPDVMALGFGTQVINTFGTIGAENGTSVAAPLLASLAAGIRQAFPNITNKELYSAVIRSGDQASSPDNLRGYGIPNFTGVKNLLTESNSHEPVMIYPNPVGDTALRVLLKSPAGETCTITLYDRIGRFISEMKVVVTSQNNPVYISTEGMTQGMYIIKVESGSVSKTFKWIKV